MKAMHTLDGHRQVPNGKFKLYKVINNCTITLGERKVFKGALVG